MYITFIIIENDKLLDLVGGRSAVSEFGGNINISMQYSNKSNDKFRSIFFL